MVHSNWRISCIDLRVCVIVMEVIAIKTLPLCSTLFLWKHLYTIRKWKMYMKGL